jgi:uncharacterized protein YkwD
MKVKEKEMIYEINLLRSDPPGYIQNLQEDIQRVKKELEVNGKGEKNYSLEKSYEKTNGIDRLKKTDTVWYYQNEEEMKAIESLITELKNLHPLHTLQPDKGLYTAAVMHSNDQNMHHWNLGHIGSDGYFPWDRIRKYSPGMKEGNENLAGKFPEPSAREIVIQLLIDDGIPGYGHRENILNPEWTHIACYCAGLKDGMYQWIQEFGSSE